MKKILSLLIIVSIIIGTIPAAFAATFVQPNVITYFQTMNDWTKVQNATTTLPAGIVAYKDSDDYVKNMYSVADDGGVVAAIAGGGIYVVPFSEVISTGMLHISFDAKGTNFYAMAVANGTTNAMATSIDNNTKYLTQSNADRALIKYDGTKLYYANNSNTIWGYTETQASISNLNKDNWHKYEIIYDFDLKTIKMYADGINIGQVSNLDYGVKAFEFRLNYGNDAALYLDNLYINHYTKNVESIYDDIKVGVDCENFASNGSVILSLSEKVNNAKDAVVLTNIDTEESVDVTATTDIGNGIKLTLPALGTGNYVISFNESAKGALSQKTITDSVKFSIAGEIDKSAIRYLVNEDFDNYKGGVPVGWNVLNTDLKGNLQSKTSVMTASDNGTGKAFSLGGTEGASEVVKEFNNTVHQGVLTMEFDVKPDDGKMWGIALMTEADMSDDNYIPTYTANYIANATTLNGSVQKNAYAELLAEAKEAGGESFSEDTWKAEKWVDAWYAYIKDAQKGLAARRLLTFHSRQNGYLVGSKTNGGNEVLYNTKFRNYFSTDTTSYKLDSKEFTHIKLALNTADGKLDIYVGNNEKKTATLDATRWQPQKVYNVTTGKEEYMYGFKGIGLFGLADFDNLKVYTENSYNALLDFSKYSTNNPHLGFIKTSKPGENGTSGSVIDAAFGYSGRVSVTDGVAKIYNTGRVDFPQTSITVPLSVPVKGLRAFDVEFSFKTGTTANDGFGMTFANKSNLDNTRATGENETFRKGAFKANVSLKKFYFINNDYFVSPQSSNISQNGTVITSGDTDVAMTPDTWYKVKFSVIPENDTVYFQTVITDEKTNATYTSQKFEANSWKAKLEDGVYGIMFCALGDKLRIRTDSGKEDGHNDATNSECYLKDVKVSEPDASYKAFVTDAKMIDHDDVKTGFAYEIDETIKGFELGFSSKVNGANHGVKLINTSNNTVLNGEYYSAELSDDGKKVAVTLNKLLPENTDIAVAVIGNDIELDSSYVTEFATYYNTVKYVPSESSSNERINLSEYRLYESILDASTTDANDTVWVPLQATTLKDKATVPELKLVAKGVNAASSNGMSVIVAGYDKEGALLSAIPYDYSFEWGTIDFEKDITIDPTWAKFAVFGWNDLNDIYPITQKIDYELPVVSAE